RGRARPRARSRPRGRQEGVTAPEQRARLGERPAPEDDESLAVVPAKGLGRIDRGYPGSAHAGLWPPRRSTRRNRSSGLKGLVRNRSAPASSASRSTLSPWAAVSMTIVAPLVASSERSRRQ